VSWRHGALVRFAGQAFKHTLSRRWVRPGAPGRVLALRDDPEAGRLYLVRWTGHRWPVQHNPTDLEDR